MEDLITIIVPIYNVEKYLRECIESICRQTYRNIEIILINDGSNDNSAKICDEYKEKDSRIKVIHKENGGVSSARNKGLEIAKGAYITFVDGDDYIDEKYCEKLLKNLKENNVECILCGFNRIYEKTAEVVTKGENLLLDKNKFLNSILTVQGGAGIAAAKLWKRKAVINVRFNEKIKIGEDSLFGIQAAKNVNNVYILNEALYNYRFNKNSAVRKYNKDFANICLKSMQEAKKYIEKEYSKEEIKDKFNNYITYHVLLITVNYCFNNENNLNWIKQIKCLKEVANIPEYKEGIKKSDYDGLSLTRKITLFTIKHRLYFITMLIGKIRQAQFKR